MALMKSQVFKTVEEAEKAKAGKLKIYKITMPDFPSFYVLSEFSGRARDHAAAHLGMKAVLVGHEIDGPSRTYLAGRLKGLSAEARNKIDAFLNKLTAGEGE